MSNPPELRSLFFPYATRQLAAMKEAGFLVHYTSAAGAANILRSREVWMRKTRAMNDFSEVEHGKECLREAYAGEAGTRFSRALESVFPGIKGKLESAFNGWLPHFEKDTFVTSLSEHLASENELGRLSMWRAYGQGSGVALVVRMTPFESESDALKAYSSPVAYLSRAGFASEFAALAANIEANRDVLSAHGEELTLGNAFTMLRFAMLCTKHLGFAEEREWRVLHNPRLEPSERLRTSVELIHGTPQRVYRIPLESLPEEGLAGMEVAELLERVIIGPCADPILMWEGFVELLTEAGVPNAHERIVISNIPLRI
ncbi:MAG TPA: DUF2971 domain-containing protein [Vitreimonas sp.]|uniref:DUF2971 domain-containing protein n=1 Tax=Vitreimonas sp. TaxID=3069702 RepID=UPI002D298FC6|nr:DUF2971 domain-containing protein [Vitreimonas sp.]HYD88865.1 DUF2971 domain-containing protein [Vitreimonas sp.]